MSMPAPLDKHRMALDLDTFRLIVDSNAELVESRPQLKEQLAHTLQAAQSCLDALHLEEEGGDPVRCDVALTDAQLALLHIRDLIDQLLAEG